MFCKKVFLEILQNSQENTCVRFPKVRLACNFIKKETLAQVFPCEFYEISKNTIFTEHLRVITSVKSSVALEILGLKEIVGLKEIFTLKIYLRDPADIL